MTRRRRVLPGASYRITARCHDRRFYLVPSADVDAVVGFVLAYCARKYAIDVHSWVCMSNHIHLDVTDTSTNITRFMGLFKSLVARALNCKRGTWEYFWAPPPSALVRVVDREDAIRGIAYSLANPVAAGLVSTLEAWPGKGTLPGHLQATRDECFTYTFDKPNFFFRREQDGGKIPDRISLTLTPHPFGADDPDRFIADLRDELRTLLERARREMKAKRLRPLGAARVRQQNYWRRPKTREPRRRLIPTFAARSTKLRVRLAFEQLAFEAAYDAALATWMKRGKAEFPHGTCKMKGLPGVAIRYGPASTSEPIV